MKLQSMCFPIARVANHGWLIRYAGFCSSPTLSCLIQLIKVPMSSRLVARCIGAGLEQKPAYTVSPHAEGWPPLHYRLSLSHVHRMCVGLRGSRPKCRSNCFDWPRGKKKQQQPQRGGKERLTTA